MRLKSHVRLVGLLALAGLAIGLALLLRVELGRLRAAQAVATGIQTQALLADLIHQLQRERGLTTIRLASGVQGAALVQQQGRTDMAAARALTLGALQADDLSGVIAYRHRMAANATDTAQLYTVYAAAINTLLLRFGSGARDIELTELRTPLLTHTTLLYAKEQLGQLRAIVGGQLGQGALGEAEIHSASQHLALFDAAVATYLEETDAAHAERMRQVMASASMHSLRELVADLAAAPVGRKQDQGVEAAVAWFEVASAVVDELQALATLSIDEAQVRAEKLVASSRTSLLWRTALLLLGWALSCWLVYQSLRHLLGTIQRLTADTQALLGRIEGLTGAHLASASHDLDTGFMDLVERVDQLSHQANTDALTGLLNRHGLASLFHTEQIRARRHGRDLSLVLFDIDHFKHINDEYGHLTGDGVLRELATLLRRIVRAEDIIARWGGEEFVLIAPECNETSAAALVEKLREAIAAHDFRLPRQVTASFGVVQVHGSEDLEQLIARADTALYRAKTLGRNQICCAGRPGVDVPSQLGIIPG